MNYSNIYFQRLNRYGNNYQSRIQGEREQNFDVYLLKSIYRVEFMWEHQRIVGSFERYKQDDTKTLHYLLTKVDVELPNGLIVWMPDDNTSKCKKEPWMVYYKEEIQASGYNRYIMLRMTHKLKWYENEMVIHESWAYLYGQEDNMLKDELKSRSRSRVLYMENLKSSFFILPRNEFIKKDYYLVAGEEPFEQHFRVTGFDLISTPGVEYVTIDPVYEYDLSLPPERPIEPEPIPTEEDEYFWLDGGITNGDT